ncbi:MAG: alpha/beta hydrolase [Rhodospirillales bacterium]|jgi:acylglycerol lipase|nr:alpha/beta hydrolase [Rhodospirillales bacterium]
MIRWVLVMAISLLSACAPRIQEPGPAIVEPTLGPDAFLAADGTKLPLRTWESETPPAAIALAVHGFNDYSNSYADLGAYLAQNGITVYAYDQRGFGETNHRGLWPGADALADDLSAIAREIRAKHPQIPLVVMGESMGGAVVMVAMARPDPPPADALVLFAPAVWGRETMPWYQRAALAVASHTVPWLRLTGEGLRIRASDNNEMLRALGRDPLFIKKTRVDALHGITNLMDKALAAAKRLKSPALILYGEKDEIIPRRPTFRMLDQLPNDDGDGEKRIALYENGYHMLFRDLDREIVWRDVVSWVGDRQASLPSGADAHAKAVRAR